MSQVAPILVTGVSGQVGHELLRALAPLGAVRGVDRQTLDLLDATAIRRVVRAVRPRIIVNAAAYTAVDLAESETGLAHAINGDAPRILAEEAAALGAGMVHFSTDYVFDGEATQPYRETDITAPRCVYGHSKLAGEQAVLASNSAAIVLRTSWVYSLRGRNFFLTMQRLAAQQSAISVVDDQIGSPTSARLLAAIVAVLLARLRLSPEQLYEYRGIYHVACSGATSWYQFAMAIVGAEGSSKIAPMPTSAYPTAARRPAYSVLDCSRLCEKFELLMPSWLDTLALTLADQRALGA